MALLLLLGPPVTAQVTARQSTAFPPEELHFASPMILDLPFPNVTMLGKGSTLAFPDVYKYVCDQHVRLRGLSLTLGKRYKGPKRARLLELVINSKVLVADSYDRRVDIHLRLLNGDGEIATKMLPNVKAEEERATPVVIAFAVEEQELRSAYAAGKQPMLQLTITVRDDR